jgi:alkanesulfonate monooxygenase SsuD/methylene tetrahydromethanopterin reductase-like flavin-dependent oxidoreductase (luciferase family)
VQKPIPVWAGGKGGPRLLRLAARLASGWNTVWRVSPAAYRAAIGDVAAACEETGRDRASFGLSVGLYGIAGGDEQEARQTFERARESFPGDAMREETWETWSADTLSGSPELIRERADAFAAMGVDELIVSPWVLPFAVIDPAQVELFAQALLDR